MMKAQWARLIIACILCIGLIAGVVWLIDYLT